MKYEARDGFPGANNEEVTLTIKPVGDHDEPFLDIEVDGMAILDLDAETFDLIASRLEEYRNRIHRTAA